MSAFDRRNFFVNGAYLTAGAALGTLLPRGWRAFQAPPASAQGDAPSAEAQLRKLKLKLPPVRKPTASLVPAVRVGDMLYVSGHGPTGADGKSIVGKVGKDLDVKQGQAAARQVGLVVLGVVRHELGSLDRVARVVKVLGMVNAVPDFTEQPKVINGCSDLFVEVFGERGRHARSAVGMGSLPGGITVEIEAIATIR